MVLHGRLTLPSEDMSFARHPHPGLEHQDRPRSTHTWSSMGWCLTQLRRIASVHLQSLEVTIISLNVNSGAFIPYRLF